MGAANAMRIAADEIIEADEIACNSDYERLRSKLSEARAAHFAKEAAGARVTALVKLDHLAYEQQRKMAAKELGLRPSVLDNLVEQRRDELADAAGTGF